MLCRYHGYSWPSLATSPYHEYIYIYIYIFIHIIIFKLGVLWFSLDICVCIYVCMCMYIYICIYVIVCPSFSVFLISATCFNAKSTFFVYLKQNYPCRRTVVSTIFTHRRGNRGFHTFPRNTQSKVSAVRTHFVRNTLATNLSSFFSWKCYDVKMLERIYLSIYL